MRLRSSITFALFVCMGYLIFCEHEFLEVEGNLLAVLGGVLGTWAYMVHDLHDDNHVLIRSCVPWLVTLCSCTLGSCFCTGHLRSGF